jgi:hypothetical protein
MNQRLELDKMEKTARFGVNWDGEGVRGKNAIIISVALYSHILQK